MTQHHLSIDLETYSSIPIAKAGAFRYIASADFEILLFAYSLDGAPVEVVDVANGERVPDWLVMALHDPCCIKHAYNAPFEWACLSKVYGQMIPSQWRCTMFHGLYAGYTAGLDATGKALGLPEDKQKLSTGKALIRYFCVPCKATKANGNRTRNMPWHDPEKWSLFKEYNRQDVVTEMEIERRLAMYPVPDFVQKQWETDLTINARGVMVDMDLCRGALDIGERVKSDLMAEAAAISQLDNPNSVSQLAAWLNAAMDDEQKITDLRKETVATLLAQDGHDSDVRRMLEIRQELGKTSTKKYDAMENCVGPDGRIRGLLQFYGANRTGRWAGRLVQVQNLPRTYTDPIPLARRLVKDENVDGLRVIYGNVPDSRIIAALLPRPRDQSKSAPPCRVGTQKGRSVILASDRYAPRCIRRRAQGGAHCRRHCRYAGDYCRPHRALHHRTRAPTEVHRHDPGRIDPRDLCASFLRVGKLGECSQNCRRWKHPRRRQKTGVPLPQSHKRESCPRLSLAHVILWHCGFIA